MGLSVMAIKSDRSFFAFFDFSLNRRGRHCSDGMAVLAAFKHLTGMKNSLILVAPNFLENLFCRQFKFPFGNGNSIAAKLVCQVMLQNERTSGVDGTHIALITKDRRTIFYSDFQ